MKKLILSFVLIQLTLAACSPSQADLDAAAAEAARSTRVAASVAATTTARAEMTQAAPTITPSPARQSLDKAILDNNSLNVLLGIWPDQPLQSMAPSSNPLCLKTCYQQLWVSADGKATLQVSLFEFSNRDSVVTKLREIKASQEVLGVKEVPLPEYSDLPTDSWMQDNGTSGSRYTLHTRKGKVLVVLTIYLPQYEQDQNLLFLSLFGARQIELLHNSGW